jgi:predicted HicB family RNase H-like nuclease
MRTYADFKSPLCFLTTGEKNQEMQVLYKGYAGHFAYDEDLDLFEGSVSNCKDLITFQGKSIDAVIIAFKDAINEYIEWCEKIGKEPEKQVLEP